MSIFGGLPVAHARRLTSKALVTAFAMLAGLVAAPAHAQLTSTVTGVQTRIAADPNGVDLVTGSFNLRHTDLTFGPNAATRLTLDTEYGSGGGDRYFGYAYERTEGSSSYVYTVQGNITEKFLVSGSSYVSVSGNGATLTHPSSSIYELTYRNGTKVEFYRQHYTITGLYHGSGTLDGISAIQYPDGERLSFAALTKSSLWCESLGAAAMRAGEENAAAGEQETQPGTALIPPDKMCFEQRYRRVQSITSSLGYQLRFTYAAEAPPSDAFSDPPRLGPPDPTDFFTRTSATAVNLGVDYCDPYASTCSYSKPWPTITYSTYKMGPTPSIAYTDSMGRQWSISKASSGGILSVSVRRPSSSTPYIVAQLTDQMVTQVETPAGTWHYTHSDSGSTRTMVVTDPLGHTRTVVSDLTTGLITSDTDDLGNTRSYEYDAYGRVTKATLPEGNYETYAYDARGNVTQTVRHAKPGTGLANITTSATYPSSCTSVVSCNKPLTTTDARSHVTTWQWNATHGGLEKVTRPAVGGVSPQTRYTWSARQAYYKDSTGTIVASGSPVYRLTGISECQSTASCAGTVDEAKTVIAYGATGVANTLKVSAVTKKAGNGTPSSTTAFGYDVFGNLTSIDGPLSGTGDTVTMRYDADYELTGVIRPDPDGGGVRAAQRITYNADGLVTKREVGTVTGTSDAAWAAFVTKQQLTSAYDADDFKLSDTLTAGGTTYGVTQYSYDAMGRLQCTAQRMNSAAWGSLPTSACTAQTAGAEGPDRISRAYYDEVGRVEKTVSGYGTSAASNDAVATFTDNGRLDTLVDGEGNLTHYFYDGFDRLVKTRYPLPAKGSGNSSTTDYERYVYDANGNLVTRLLRDGQKITYTYDDLNRLVTKNLPGSEPTATYAYDLLGRPTSVSQGGTTLSFGYDALSRLLTQTGPHGTLTSTWDAAGRRTKLEWDDGFYVSYDYDMFGNLKKIRENGAASGIGLLARYSYDDLGNRIHATYGNGTASAWTPDPVGRLKKLIHNMPGTASDLTRTFTYNPAGQIASETSSNDAYAWTDAVNVDRNYTANGLNQYTAAGSVSLGYDARGNLTSSGSDTYAYSSENLLTSGPGVSLAYDPLMRLAEVIGGTTTRFAYDGLDLVAEYNSAGTLTDRYVFGPGTDEPIVWYHGSGTSDRRWLAADERGSIIAITDDTGAALGIDTYDEYGIPGAGNIGRFQYTGQAWLPEPGLYYYKARMYSPSLGRFMQTDPIGYADGMNLYGYVGNDPVNFVDPTGLAERLVGSCYRVPTYSIGDHIYVGYTHCDYRWMHYPGPHEGRPPPAPAPAPGRGKLAPQDTQPSPQNTKPIDRCIVNFMNSVEPAVDWGSVRLSKGGNVPGNYTTWSSTQIAVPSDAYANPSNFILFHEFGHVHAYKMHRLSVRSYIGEAIAAPFLHPLTPFSELHDTLPSESFANQYRNYLLDKYKKAGKPCGEL